MTGTGTQTDPYIIESFEDFLNISGGENSYYKLGVNIDANDTPYAEGWEVVHLNCYSLDGNGHCIRNIFINSVSKSYAFIRDSSELHISNLNIENAVIMSNGQASLFYGSTAQGTPSFTEIKLFLSNVNITAELRTEKVSSPSTFSVISGNIAVQINDSTLNTRIIADYNYNFINGNCFNCHIRLDLTFFDSSSSYTAVKGSANNTMITGTINYTGASSSVRFVLADYLNNSYFVIKSTGITSMTIKNCTSVCFYDHDVLGLTVSIAGSGSSFLKSLTTEECKDADYLTSIGFICGGV